MAKIHEFQLPALGKGDIRLGDHQGRVLLLVNTASKCGLTPQYEGLEALHRAYADQGLSVIGFPCDQFGHQEPGTADEIGAFCQRNYGVSFPLSEKIDVNGSKAHPLWKWLKQQKKDGILGWFGIGTIRWNFTKFLVDRSGNVVARFSPGTLPSEIEAHIRKLL